MTTDPIDPRSGIRLVLETEPRPADVQFLDDRLYEFNVQATGIADGKLLGLFMRAADGSLLGGAYGWTYGGACYIRYLFVPERLRRQSYGTTVMRAVEREARSRGCTQIILETASFQAPGFYRKLGFDAVHHVDDYPRGHQYITLIKRLD